MKKYLVIGNPIEHSLSPILHNHWIKINNINAIYEKKKLQDDDLKNIISDIREKKIQGINVTVPFKNKIIKYLDELSEESETTQSVNTIFLKGDKIIGHNTDIGGFELSIKNLNLNLNNKKILILGAGGVVPSIILSSKKLKASKIMISNRTKEKADKLKSLFQDIIILDWGEVPEFDVIINATSVGLNSDENLEIDFSRFSNKFFYDVIYNPAETNFLKLAKRFGNKTSNGRMMFIYQAFLAFKKWHNFEPQINNDIIKLLKND